MGGPCPSGDVWMFDGRTRGWTTLEVCPSPRVYSALAMLPIRNGDRRVIMYGGDEMDNNIQVLAVRIISHIVFATKHNYY